MMETVDVDWLNVSPCCALAEREIHVWRICLDVPSSALRWLSTVLAAEETKRADRFHFKRDSCRYITAHGFLRTILGHYLQASPAQIKLTTNAHGKPALVTVAGGSTLKFNLSHSEGWALIALTLGCEIGVDLEYIRQDIPGEEIAGKFFSPTEIKALRALAATDKTAAFYQYWTQKEAYLKGLSEGMAGGLDHFYCVPVDPAQSTLWRVEREDGAISGWTGCTLYPVEGFVGAVAVAAETWRLRCGQWTY